jgi:hypothetical protein
VPARAPYDYAVVRVVPRVEREEFLNVGVIVHAPTLGYLDCALRLDVERLAVFAGGCELEGLREHLAALGSICAGDRAAGPIALLPRVERFRWLVAPRSSVIQTSPVHGGMCEDPAAALRELFAARV